MSFHQFAWRNHVRKSIWCCTLSLRRIPVFLVAHYKSAFWKLAEIVQISFCCCLFVLFPSSVLLSFTLAFVFPDRFFTIIANLRSARTDSTILLIHMQVSCSYISFYLCGQIVSQMVRYLRRLHQFLTKQIIVFTGKLRDSSTEIIKVFYLTHLSRL